MDWEGTDWIGIIPILILGVLSIGLMLIVGNNYIEYQEYNKQAKVYAAMYPSTTAMYNGVQYTCEFRTEAPTIKLLDLHVQWHYWYIYLIVGIIVFAIDLFIMSILTFGGE